MLQPDSVGTALIFSKMLKVEGAERYGLLRFFANRFTKVPEITWSAGWDESNFWYWDFLCSADKINSTYLSLLPYTDVACYKVHLSHPFFLIYFLQWIWSWHGKQDWQTWKLKVSMLRPGKVQITSESTIFSLQLLGCAQRRLSKGI